MGRHWPKLWYTRLKHRLKLRVSVPTLHDLPKLRLLYVIRALFSDVLCGAEFAVACVHAAAANVRINHRSMRDEAVIMVQAELLAGYLEEAEAARELSVQSKINEINGAISRSATSIPTPHGVQPVS